MTEPTHEFAQGSVVDLRSLAPADRDAAFVAAFDYRGDVTLTLDDGASLECFVFDHRPGDASSGGRLRVLESTSGRRRDVACASVSALAFTGKDTAAGKTWENWVRRYVEKRLAGERASIEADPLD